ncbi:tyrosine-type recombinase/integrase [Streptomyces cinereoruber]|uniref:tyrosine-type recombinase/integrase n=1 Tax=Streptomyces cinereoruber TaxID=67260 RepID=UPI003624D4D8
MFEDKTYKRCSCKGQLSDKEGKLLYNPDGSPKIGGLEKTCPKLAQRTHGSWYYSIELPPNPDGSRRPRAKKGGFRTQEDAANAAEKVWKAAQNGINVLSKETVEEYLRRWLKKKKHDLAVTTHHEYTRDTELYFIPHLGKLQMRHLHTRSIQAMYDWIVEDNERREEHRAKTDKLGEEARAAYETWMATPQDQKELRTELRARWWDLRRQHTEARKKVQRVTGPATMRSINATLSSALADAVDEELIAKNYATMVSLPKVTKPKGLVWTDERVARWKRTGKKPSPVMVWTTEQTAQFLDFVSGDRLFPLWHLVVFRGLRRGEAAAITWHEIDLKKSVLHVTEQLVTVSYEVHDATPKADSVRDIKLDSQAVALLKAWRKAQQAEREMWEKENAWIDSGGRVFTHEDGKEYHPQVFTDRWDRLVELSGLPPIRLHDARHGAGSQAFAAGVAPKVIQQMLGHSSLRMTMDTYTSIMPTLEDAAAEAAVVLVEKARKKAAKAAGKPKKDKKGPEKGPRGKAAGKKPGPA